MKHRVSMLKWLLFCLFFTESILNAQEMVIITQDGEIFVEEINPQESFDSIQNRIAVLCNETTPNFIIQCSGKEYFKEIFDLHARSQGGYIGCPRNYLVDVTPEEKMDIRFIVTTLANKSLIAIALIKSDLEQAGDRIDHIHPLKFLMTVFMDEELKVGIRNIRGKGWVWNHFFGGLKESLSTETQIGNLKEEYINDFAEKVKISPDVIRTALLQQEWDDFIDLLIINIPRRGDHDRYDQ